MSPRLIFPLAKASNAFRAGAGVTRQEVRIGLAKRYKAEPVASDLISQVFEALPTNKEEAGKVDRAKIQATIEKIRRLEKQHMRMNNSYFVQKVLMRIAGAAHSRRRWS